MFVIIGIVVVFACVLGGYVAMGGKLGVLWQPFEVVIIVSAAIGAMIVGNTKTNLGRIGKGFGKAAKADKPAETETNPLFKRDWSGPRLK